MKQKHVDAAREVRLWIGQVIAPLGLGVAYLFSVKPEYKEAVRNKVNNIKYKFKRDWLVSFILFSHRLHSILWKLKGGILRWRKLEAL